TFTTFTRAFDFRSLSGEHCNLQRSPTFTTFIAGPRLCGTHGSMELGLLRLRCAPLRISPAGSHPTNCKTGSCWGPQARTPAKRLKFTDVHHVHHDQSIVAGHWSLADSVWDAMFITSKILTRKVHEVHWSLPFIWLVRDVVT